MNRDAGAQQRLHVAAMCLLALAFWILSRAYLGIYHDSQLYTLQALARLGPSNGLAMDVFLRYGSQDSYTLFSPIYAFAIDLLGLENAARTLAALGQLAWVAAATYLAVTVLDGYWRWVGLALLAGLPGFYGAGEVFRFAEPFLTPRIFAESLVLVGLAAGIRNRLTYASAAMVLALLLHPLMAAGGVLCLACIALDRHPRVVPITVIAGLSTAILIAIIIPIGPLRMFPSDWLGLVRTRSEFLLISDWDSESWEGVLTTLVALYIAATSPGPRRAVLLAKAGFTVSLLGLLVTWVGGTLFNVVLLIQGQAWRWSWVGTVVVMLVSVTQVPAAWRLGPMARSVLLLFLAGFLLKGWFAVALYLSAALVWFFRDKPLPGVVSRITFLASVGLSATCVLGWAGLHLTAWPNSGEDAPAVWAVEPVIRPLADGVIPLLLIVLFSRAARAQRFGRTLVIAAAGAAGAACLPASIDWSRTYAPDEISQGATRWREVIPIDAEVLWPQNAIGSWVLLERRHYVSLAQSAGILFSEDTARELDRRARIAHLVTPPRFVFGGQGWSWQLTDERVRSLCVAGGPEFIVSARRLSLPPAAAPVSLPVIASGNGSALHWLYSCADIRRAPTMPST